jgi:hypothetical protein
LFDAFSIERWRQDTRLGRDIRAEVVYKGFLFPFGHRASLVKLTERRFVAGPGGVAKGPVAFLIQRFFLRIGTPLKTYPAIGQPNGGRTWPTERLEIVTRVTPDLIDPADATPSGTVSAETPSGRIFLYDNNSACPGLVFWPRVRRGRGGEVNFELQVDGRGARTRLPLIFVDNTAANDVHAMKALRDYYNALKLSGDIDPRRIMEHGGSKRRYAAEKEPDDTSFETRSWVIAAEGRETPSSPVALTEITGGGRTFAFDNNFFDFGALLQGADQPPFYPVMQHATVRIGQVDRLLGKLGKGNNPTTDIVVGFDDEYKAFGFPPDDRLAKAPTNIALEHAAKTDVYLDFETDVKLDPGRDGERTGGPVRPNTPLVAMSRSRGPVGNHKETSLTGRVVALSGPKSNGLDNPKPGTFFDVDAKILGILPLGQALSFIGAGLSSAPQFNEVTHYTSALLTEAQNEEAGAAVAKVRDRLLIPLRDALRTLARQYYDAVKDPQNPGEFIEEDALVRIERLYPDVGKAYRELADALDSAIVTSATARDLDALLVAFGAIYGTGRRFLAAIERVANDPLAPVHAALLEAFNTKIAELIGSIEGVLGPILSDLRSALDKAKTDLYGNLAKLFRDPDFTVWRRIVFALPGSYSITDITFAAAVDSEVKDALADAAVKSDFLVVLASGNLQQAADAIGKKFETEFDARINAAASPLKDALIEARRDWKAASDDAAERIQGLLYTTALTEIASLLTAMGQLADPTQKTISTLVGALQQAAAAAIGAVQSVIDFDLSVAAQICSGVVTVVATLFDEVSPPDSFIQQVRTAKSDMNTAFEAAKAALLAFGLQQEAEDIRKQLDDRLAALGEVQNAVSHAKGQITGLAAEVCRINNPAHLPLAAFAALARTRDTLEAEVNKFQRALVTPLRTQSPLQTLLAKIPDSTQPGKDARTALANAAKAAGKASEILGQLARDATSLRASNPLQNTIAALMALKAAIPDASFGARIDALLAAINAASARFTALKAEIKSEIDALDVLVQQTVADPKAYVDALITAVAKFPPTIDAIVSDVVANVEQKLLQETAKYIIDGAPYVNQMILIAMDGLGVVFKVLASAQVAVVNARKTAWVALGGKPGGAGPNPAPGGIGDDLSSITLERILTLLFVLPVPSRTGLQPPPANPDPTEVDYLAAERNELTTLAGKFGTAANFDKATFTAVKKLLEDWKQDNGSAQRLAKQLGDAAAAVLSGDLKRIVDLEGARRRIEEKLKELVPSKIVLDYGIKAELKQFGDIFLPHTGSQISLSAGATFDFLDVNAPPRFKATCQIDPFDINLFDVVTLMFNGAEFVSESGKGSDFNISYKDFVLGPAAAFLQPLQALMNPGGDGPYVRLASGFPGIEAGYTLDLGIISIGTLSFINVSISAACILPFDKQDAIFTVAIGQKERPVMLSCLPYTGGGFLKLYANAQKMRGFEASFEFGGGGAFGFGPLTGQGRICTGIYLRQFGNDVTIEGYFYAGGEAHIACFAISATLVVRISQHLPDGLMLGSAVFTFSFSIGFAKLRYSVGVQRTIGKGFSGTRSVALAEKIFDLADMKGREDAASAVVTSNAMAQQEDWIVYQTYFAEDINGFPKWQ